MRFLLPALGVVLVLVGAVWTLQESNLLGGSFMSGFRLWLVIGLVALVAGIWLVVREVRAGGPERPRRAPRFSAPPRVRLNPSGVST